MSEGGPVKDKDCTVMEGTDHVESYEPRIDFGFTFEFRGHLKNFRREMTWWISALIALLWSLC